MSGTVHGAGAIAMNKAGKSPNGSSILEADMGFKSYARAVLEGIN